MNISDIEIPEYWPIVTVIECIIGVVALGFFFILFKVVSQGRQKFSRRQTVTGGVLVAIAIGAGATNIILTNDMTDHQNSNFAAALQRTYGATSSKTYQDIKWSHDREATLTRDGKDTLVRFDFGGGTIRPVIPSQSDYPSVESNQ